MSHISELFQIHLLVTDLPIKGTLTSVNHLPLSDTIDSVNQYEFLNHFVTSRKNLAKNPHATILRRTINLINKNLPMKNLLLLLFFFHFGIAFSQTNKEFWIANSDPIPQMSVLDFESLYTFKYANKSVRLIVGGAGGATDFGPYRSAYLVFDNGYEMPWRYAIYDLGSFGSIDEVSKTSDSELLIKAMLYSKLEDSECEYCNLSITLDLSEVLAKEERLDQEMTEGSIVSQIKVSLEELKD